ncbi:hypothetical protein QTJ16_006739 [Diplocarpon rosae]|uniref:Protein kinase domain-containing protein n=1 Tax=Diplocarpon rosae TaxID=946125 RepID=A0AAD9WAD6_9HELO|nr:hypothetical protein QTJ16_006739 [Diplocarpon rosae]
MDVTSQIPEAEEDETSSEAANEPSTPPAENQYSHGPFKEMMDGTPTQDIITHPFSLSPNPLAMMQTSGTLPTKRASTFASQTPQSTIQRMTLLPTEKPSIKRGLSGLFKRAQSHSVSNLNAHIKTKPGARLERPVLANGYVSEILPTNTAKLGFSTSSSAYTSGSNSPPTPGSPATHGQGQAEVLIEGSSLQDDCARSRKSSRSSGGFGLRDRITKHIAFHPHEKATPKLTQRHRATSMDLESSTQGGSPKDKSQVQLPSRQVWGLAADAGTGLKSRRLSMSLPDTFMVDDVELYSEFSDQSKIVGRRGKTIGKGATANVRLMVRKGGSSETYAVKEFRGKSRNEKSEDYERKVKSEFSIAKSAHHPNIVETFRLCTHNGRWSHVMEFCEQGDLFSLVSQKYLSRDDRLVDRLCLFKQLLQGLNYLHANGIAHRDVKLENLLLTRDSKLKITDFGVSEVFCGVHPGLRSAGGQCGRDMGEIRLCAPGMCGSPPYVAPEVIAKQEEYDPRPLDAWGAAIVMLCMTANGVLWDEAKPGSSPLYDDLVRGWTKWNTKHPEAAVGITESDYPYVGFFDQHVSPPALRRILLTMLNPDPTRRATISTIAKNRWMKNVECCQVDSYDEACTTIDASRARSHVKSLAKVVHHNHLPPSSHLGHRLVRLPGSTDM